MENVKEIILEEAEKLLEQIAIKGEVSVDDVEGGFRLNVDTEENALLIGKHGNTLSSFENVLSLIVAKKTGEFARITVEVGGYRQEREDYLSSLALRLKDEVVETGVEKTVRGLKPWERRVVHLALSEEGDILTESSGEGRDRVLVIKKK